MKDEPTTSNSNRLRFLLETQNEETTLTSQDCVGLIECALSHPDLMTGVSLLGFIGSKNVGYDVGVKMTGDVNDPSTAIASIEFKGVPVAYGHWKKEASSGGAGETPF